MRLIQQYLLTFSRPGSNKVKVFEIDLCEVGTDRFVVNYRYGRQGRPLRDGTNTLQPVDRAAADRALAKMLSDKTRSGYQIVNQPTSGAAAPSAAPTPAAAPAPISSNARHQPSDTWTPSPAPADGPDLSGTSSREEAILRWLAWHKAPPAGVKAKWPVHRVVWRAGELRMAEATEPLIALLSGSHGTDYAIAWAIGRCGGSLAERALKNLAAHDSPSVQHIVTSSLSQVLTGIELSDWQTGLLDRLPEAVRAGLGGNLIAALRAHRPDDPTDLLIQLYATGQPSVRAALLGLSGALDPGRAADLAALRGLLQLAEHHDDGALLAAVLLRLEAVAPVLKSSARQKLLQRPWRILRRMQDDGAPQWADAARGILRSITDTTHPAATQPGRLADHLRRLAGAVPLNDDALSLLTAARCQVVVDTISARLQPADPDPVFLQSLLSAGHPVVRSAGLTALAGVPAAQVQAWIDEHYEGLLTKTALLGACVSHPDPAARAAVQDCLVRSAFSAPAQQALVAAALVGLLEGEVDDAAAEDAVQTLWKAVPTALRSLPRESIIRLVQSGRSALQGLGGAQLLSWASVPDGLLDTLVTSTHPAARAAGIRLLGRLSDGLLLQHEAAILTLCADADPVVRKGGAGLLGRLLSSGSGARIAADLMGADQ